MEVRVADLRDPESLKGVTKDVDVVIHLAALMRFHAPFELLYQHNVAGTQELAKDALHQGVKQFVYVSSTEAIGPVVDIPGDETSPYHPTYAYGKTKQLAEVWLQKQNKNAGLPLTILRPTGVYGPGDMYVSLSTVMAVAHKKLRLLPGKGDRFVHFTYVDDIVQGIQRTIDMPERSFGETFILASDEYTTYKEMFSVVAQILNVPPPSRSVPMGVAKLYLSFVEWNNKRKGIDDFVMHASLIDDMKTNRAYSNKKAKTMLGFQPQYRYTEGMQRTIAWYKEKNLL